MDPATAASITTSNGACPRRTARFVVLLLPFALLCASARPAAAQQAIVTMPSADITGARTFFFMHESQLRLWGPKRYWAGTYFLTYGLGAGTELAATVYDYGVSYDGTSGNTTLALGFKSGIRLFAQSVPRLQLQISFGAMVMTSLVDRGVGPWMYSLATMRLPVLRTRLGVGASWAGEQFYGPGNEGVSLMASIEQPVPIPRIHGLSIVAEWFSGSHDLSNLIVGVTYHHAPTWIFVLGWKIPTRDGGFRVDNQALVAEVGLFFPTIGGRRPEDRTPLDDEDEGHHASGGHPNDEARRPRRHASPMAKADARRGW